MNKSQPETLTPNYFEEVYRANADPWNFETSEYERAKYAATLAALPQTHYQKAFEIGCSIGVLTKELAARCTKLLAIDVSDAALEKAQKRCAKLSQISFEKMQIPAEFPAAAFDLILVSEVGYYLAPEDWQTATEKIAKHLELNGNVVLVHWIPFVHDYPQTGDEVHESFKRWTTGKLRHLTEKREENYRLDVFEKN
ncbi:MAG: SAM-dependent methyltransferase [Pyrinomonadaceae bacterium]